jgi:phytoene dehydrogenase-like protein
VAEDVPTNSYDLVVLGDDLASLVCATLCARRQMRTLVLGEQQHARYTLGPHKLPIEPAAWPTLPGNGGERVLKELHAEHGLRRKLREPSSTTVGAQLVAPDLRVDLGVDRLAGELEREMGAARADARAWFQRWEKATELARQFDPLFTSEHAFPGVGFFERREIAKIADRLVADAAAWWSGAAEAKGSTLWRHLAAIALRHPSPPAAAMVRAIDTWRNGPVSLRGDGDAIREILVEKLTTSGGEVRAGRVTEINVSWGKR